MSFDVNLALGDWNDLYSRLQYLLDLSYTGETLPELPYDGVHIELRYFVTNADTFFASHDALLDIFTVELLPAQIKALKAKINDGDNIELNNIVFGLSKYLSLLVYSLNCSYSK